MFGAIATGLLGGAASKSGFSFSNITSNFKKVKSAGDISFSNIFGGGPQDPNEAASEGVVWAQGIVKQVEAMVSRSGVQSGIIELNKRIAYEEKKQRREKATSSKARGAAKLSVLRPALEQLLSYNQKSANSSVFTKPNQQSVVGEPDNFVLPNPSGGGNNNLLYVVLAIFGFMFLKKK